MLYGNSVTYVISTKLGHVPDITICCMQRAVMAAPTILKVYYGVSTVREGPYGVDLSDFP